MRLVIFHYHLLPGGVTQVITSSAISALKYLPDIDGITLVSGNDENTENVIANIKTQLKNFKSGEIDVDSFILPQIGYLSDKGIYPDLKNLLDILLKSFAGNIWWIHNYHLGKNPIFTEALLQIAENFPKQKIIMQIHDFPEASRYENLETLYKYVTRSIYPIYSNVRYVTINSRDSTYLTDAGIPKEMVFLLNNPVESIQKTGEEDNRYNYKRINRILTKSLPSFIENAPLLIYPVRTIRRKNVLEAGLLAKCSNIEVNLLPTLPGVSKTETGYSEIVDSCFEKGLIPGASKAGLILGDNGITFPETMSAGKIIISSSVQEGFGYLYINSLQWRKPLLARKLDIIDDFSNLFSNKFSHFYNKVNIPMGKILKKQLNQEYNKKISYLDKYLDAKIISKLKEQKLLIIKGSSIDFSYLSPLLQKQVLSDLQDPGLLKETRQMNTIILKQMEKLLSINIMNFDDSSIEKFSLQNHANQIGSIISSLDIKIKVPITHKKNIDYNITSYFADFNSISLLYDPV